MPNWLESMQQTFEYYIVDPGTWKDVRPLNNVKSCTITRDSESETLGSATIDLDEMINECYVRVYLITRQNGIRERFPLGTFLVQTPSSSFDGKVQTISLDCYTPLLELKENPTPIGYYISENTNVLDIAYRLSREHLRAPVVKNDNIHNLYNDFVANTNDTWMTFLTDLLAYAKHEFDIDDMGRILFSPKQDTASLQPVWTFDDDNSSILQPDLSFDHDLYGIPNVVEVLYSNGIESYYSKAVNNDSNSATSIISRGREILYRDTDPSIVGNPTQRQMDEYAERLLKELSTIEYTVSYTHGYCPVRLRDCVNLNYTRAGMNNVKAKVISQTIKCVPGCPVSEKAVFTTKLWR